MFFKRGGSITNDTIISDSWKNASASGYMVAWIENNYWIDNQERWDYLLSDNNWRQDVSNSYFDESYFRFVSKVTVKLYPKSPYKTDVISMTRTFECPTKKISTPAYGKVRLGAYH